MCAAAPQRIPASALPQLLMGPPSLVPEELGAAGLITIGRHSSLSLIFGPVSLNMLVLVNERRCHFLLPAIQGCCPSEKHTIDPGAVFGIHTARDGTLPAKGSSWRAGFTLTTLRRD